MATKENTILKGGILSPLIKFTIPMLLATLLQGLYGAVDLIVVGKYCSTSSVAAVSNGSQVIFTVTAIVIGLTMGATVVVGRHIGAGDRDAAAKTVAATAKLFSLLAIALSLALLLLTVPITRALKVPEAAVEQTVAYLRICSVGMLFVVPFNAVSGLFRGTGDSKSPLVFMAIACAVNIVLDLVLVGIFKLDAAGAAIATVFAQAVSVVFSLIKIKRGGLKFRVSKESFRDTSKIERQLIEVGGPIALESGLVSLSFLLIMGIFNRLGLIASASYGIAEKLYLFLSIVPASFLSSLSAFVAQNEGAKQGKRAVEALKIAMALSFCFGIGIFLLTFFRGDLLARFFTNETAVIAQCKEYLRGVSVEYLIISINYCFLGYFNGIGSTRFVMAVGLITTFLVRIPLSYYLSSLPGTNMFTIALAVPAAAAVSLVLCSLYFVYVRKRRLSYK